MQVHTLDIHELGNHTHLVHDGRYALVVDPPRDLAPVEAAAEQAGVEIATVADTHIHDDYVSGALALARRHGVDYLLSADEAVHFERVGVHDGDVVAVGRPSPAAACCGARSDAPTSSTDASSTTWRGPSGPAPAAWPHCTRPRASIPRTASPA
jgi:glyoxylase-like metal-dependent hydrolase (beta-lactamase superfamily II)